MVPSFVWQLPDVVRLRQSARMTMPSARTSSDLVSTVTNQAMLGVINTRFQITAGFASAEFSGIWLTKP
jgi:hypothetical protein